MHPPDPSLGDQPTMGRENRARSAALEPDDLLGQYRIVRLLGKGGMGEVYEAEHQVLRRRYALKLLPATIDWQGLSLERFRREAQVMAGLEHPNILKVDDFGETSGRYWLRMELVRGLIVDSGRADGETDKPLVSLQDLADAYGGKIPQDRLLGILKEVLAGLEYAHAHGAIHRDLKPGNILLYSSVPNSNMPTAKISDFGLVRIVGEEWVRSRAQLSVQRSMSIGNQTTMEKDGSEGAGTRSLLGTYEYMSPEQKRGEEVDARSDLYAVGVMTYRLLTGRNISPKPPSRVDPTLHADWDELVESALEEDRRDRIADAKAFLARLNRIEEECAAAPRAAAQARQQREAEGREAARRRAEAERESEAEARRRAAEEARAREPAVPAAPRVEDAPSPEAAYPAGTTGTFDLGDGVTMEVVWIPAGSFIMGSPGNEPGRYDDEGPQHQVTISSGFWMGKYEVTQEQWERLMGNNPSYFTVKGARKPVENVTCSDAFGFCRKLQEWLPAEMTGRTARLPTEAEWEYACRAGTTGPFAGDLDGMGWYRNKVSSTQTVGGKRANAWGLHDMHGNVWEWCWDGKREYTTASRADPLGAGASRVLRGGSWLSRARYCRSAFRNDYDPSYRNYNVGFRVVVR